MSTINSALLIIHILSVLTILLLLLLQINRSPRKLNPGILHAGLLALIAGVAMLGLFAKVHPDEVLNHSKYGIKFAILIVILFVSYRNAKKPILAKNTWLLLTGLTIANILIALLWR